MSTDNPFLKKDLRERQRRILLPHLVALEAQREKLKPGLPRAKAVIDQRITELKEALQK